MNEKSIRKIKIKEARLKLQDSLLPLLIVGEENDHVNQARSQIKKSIQCLNDALSSMEEK